MARKTAIKTAVKADHSAIEMVPAPGTLAVKAEAPIDPQSARIYTDMEKHTAKLTAWRSKVVQHATAMVAATLTAGLKHVPLIKDAMEGQELAVQRKAFGVILAEALGANSASDDYAAPYWDIARWTRALDEDADPAKIYTDSESHPATLPVNMSNAKTPDTFDTPLDALRSGKYSLHHVWLTWRNAVRGTTAVKSEAPSNMQEAAADALSRMQFRYTVPAKTTGGKPKAVRMRVSDDADKGENAAPIVVAHLLFQVLNQNAAKDILGAAFDPAMSAVKTFLANLGKPKAIAPAPDAAGTVVGPLNGKTLPDPASVPGETAQPTTQSGPVPPGNRPQHGGSVASQTSVGRAMQSANRR